MERGLLSTDAVVDGQFRVDDVSHLNRVFLVRTEPGPDYVLKVASAGDSGRVAREASVLKRLAAADVAGALRERLPTAVAFDEQNGVLTLDATKDAQHLGHFQRPGRYPRALARETGRALAALHRLPAEVTADLEGIANWAATALVHELDLAQMQTLSAGSLQVVRLVQHLDGLDALLEELVTEHAEQTTIHGDVRLENLLAVRRGVSGRRTRVQLIDWEFASVGDPAVDVGAFLGEHLRVWLLTFSRVTDAALQRSRAELIRLQPAVAAFWVAYARDRQLSATALNAILRRGVRYAGARLIGVAVEEAQSQSELSSSLEDTVRIGAEILRRPEQAGPQLLGLRPLWAD